MIYGCSETGTERPEAHGLPLTRRKAVRPSGAQRLLRAVFVGGAPSALCHGINFTHSLHGGLHMHALLLSFPALTVSALYCFWRTYEQTYLRRQRQLCQRV